MKRKDVTALLTAINATKNFWKYPPGNQELAEKLREAEAKGLIKFNYQTEFWERVK